MRPAFSCSAGVVSKIRDPWAPELLSQGPVSCVVGGTFGSWSCCVSDWTFGAHVIKGGGLMSGMLIVLSLKEIAHHFRELTELLSG